MFWRFGYQSASAIDGLLEKETVTLEELLEVEELLQECKAHNSKLVDFLAKPENLSILLGLITNSDLDESKKYKYPYLACEVISCEIMSICDGLVADNELLANFWTFLDRQAPIDPLQASYFSKVNGILIQKKVPEMIAFVRNQPNIVERLLVHIANASIAELLLKIISVEELPEAQGIVGWLSEQGLIPQLIDGLNPTLDVEVHNTTSQTILDVIAVSYQNIAALEAAIAAGDTISTEGSTSLVDQLKSPEIMKKLVGFMLDMESPNASSTLANGINIIIELIRRYCSEIEQAEYQQHQYQQQMSSPRSGFVLPTDEKVHVLATDLNGLLSVLGERVEDMAVLLEKPRTTLTYAAVAGDVTRLGSERLKTCELFAEILHMQYLYYSSPLFDRMVEAASLPIASSSGSNPVDDLTESVSRLRLSSQQNVADELVAVTDKIVKSKILPMCLKLFFDLPWNNFIHSVVYDMIAKVFNTYSYTSTTSYARPPPFEDGDDNDPPAPVENETSTLESKMVGVKASFKALVLSILVEGELSGKILEAQKRNDEEEKRPRGTRLGYMGHLTYIADEVCKLVEKCSPDFEGDDAPPLVHEDWDNYVNGVLRETKERDRQLLGGTRPSQPGQAAMQNPDLLDALPTLEDGLTGASAGDDVDGDGGGDGGGGFGQSAGDGGGDFPVGPSLDDDENDAFGPPTVAAAADTAAGAHAHARAEGEEGGVLGAARAGWEAPLESEAVTPPPPTTGGGGGGGGEVAGAVGAASLEASGAVDGAVVGGGGGSTQEIPQ